MDTKEANNSHKSPHYLLVTYPSVGHINPMLQLSKRLEHKGAKVTIALTKYIQKSFQISTSIAVETFSDGFDQGGTAEAENLPAYFLRFWQVGPQTLSQLLQDQLSAGRHVACVVYDAFLPWALDVAKGFGLPGAVFFTQSCAVDSFYYHVNKGLLKVPIESEEISVPELPVLLRSDLPSFVADPVGENLFSLNVLAEQFSNVERADWVLCNTYYELEDKVVDWMAKILPLRTVGPTIPSMYLDKRIEGDNHYGLSFTNPNVECMKWLDSKPKRSVVYVSFGSLVEVKPEQIEEVACGLKRSECHFLWVVRASEKNKLPKGFVDETSEKGLVVSWCSQMEVLQNDAVGCFVTHCGWNSTLEALSLGVPMVAIPQWSDQPTNAKYVMDVWKVGVRAKVDEKGIVRQKELEKCVKEIMEEEKGKEMRINAIKYSELAKKTVDQGGTSDKNIDEFIAKSGI